MRPRRVWRAGGSLVLTIEFREVRRLGINPGDLVAAHLTVVEPALRNSPRFRDAVADALGVTIGALEMLRDGGD